MPKTRKPYPPEFRDQMIALVRAGRTPEALAREFEPTAQSISNWVAQADRDTGRRTDGPMTASAGCRRSRFCRGIQWPASLLSNCPLDGEAYGGVGSACPVMAFDSFV